MAKKTLGAAHDDPVKIINRAIREARKAVADRDQDGIRQSAEGGWLALSSLADVAADRLGKPEPGGASARREALRSLEIATRSRRGVFVKPYELARRELHGDCFHGDSCPTDPVYTLEYYRGAVNDGMAAIDRIPKKKKRR